MLAKRIIPTILCRGRQLVKGKRFNAWRTVGLAAQAVQIHQARGVDEICLLDIAATNDHRGPDIDLIRELSDTLFAPLTVGGGICTVHDIRAVLLAGADKVVIGSAAAAPSDLVRKAAGDFGSQAIVVSVDVRNNLPHTHSGRLAIPVTPAGYAMDMAERGAGEILLQAIDRDGTMEGYDLDLIREVSQAVDIPVIASGGCSGPRNMVEAIHAGASAVAAGALFQFTDHTPKSCAEYLNNNGIEARVA